MKESKIKSCLLALNPTTRGDNIRACLRVRERVRERERERERERDAESMIKKHSRRKRYCVVAEVDGEQFLC